MSQTLTREPIEFTAGDSLSFTRCLRDYPASSGWSLSYEILGQAQPVSFTSTASGADHAVTVTSGDTAAWVEGDCVLVGFAVNGTERHRIYYGELSILPNAGAEQGDINAKTFAQQMVEKLESVMLGKASDDLLESRIGETQFRFMTPEQLRTEHGYWSSVRRQEIAKERAKAGLPTGNKILPSMRVVGFGTGFGVRPF